MTRRFLILLICFTAILLHAGAQGLSVELDGGLQGTRYTLPKGSSQLLPGGSLGLRYSFPLPGHLELLTGISGGVYRTKATLQDGIVYSSYQVDDAGSAFRYSVKTTGYKESQRFFAASVPLLLQFRTPGDGIQWYINGGGKVFAPFGSSIQVSAKQLVLSGYYPDFNIDVANLPQHGFGTVNGWKTSTSTKLKPSAALSAATGVILPLPHNMKLYAGVYVDYGLTPLNGKSDSLPVATYSATGIGQVKAGSVMNMPNAGKATMLAFGLQLRINLGTGKPKPAAERPGADVPESQRPVIDTSVIDQYQSIEGAIVFGRLNETVIPESQKDHLDEVAAILKRFPGIRISIVGHVCDGDSEPEDKKIGAERAKAVAQYLRSKGIDAGRMEENPVGESDVFEPYDPFANFQSRRAVISVLNKR